jgi:hypothetical protein
MQHLVCSVKYSVVLINSLLLTMTLYSLVRTTFVYDTKYSVIAEFHCILFSFECCCKILWLQQSKETEGIIFMVYIRTTQKHSYMYFYWQGERKQDIYIYICLP